LCLHGRISRPLTEAEQQACVPGFFSRPSAELILKEIFVLEGLSGRKISSPLIFHSLEKQPTFHG
jgi:hypothetical protein